MTIKYLNRSDSSNSPNSPNSSNSCNSGCNGRDCPCPVWINCQNYAETRKRKLKRKNNGEMTKINRWYENNFRIKYEIPDYLVTG